jgi:hypothetical protein
MEENEWEEGDVKELAKLVEKSKQAWKPTREELDTINIDTRQDERELKIRTLITVSERKNLISLLCEYVDVFAWSYADMFGLDTNIVMHKCH